MILRSGTICNVDCAAKVSRLVGIGGERGVESKKARKQESKEEIGRPYGETYVLPLDALLDDVLARRREQRRPAPFIHGILHKRLDGRDAHLAQRPVRVHGLRELVRRDAAGVHGVDPGPVELGALEAGFVVAHAADEGAREEDLRELGARVEGVWAHVRVDFVEGGELDGGERGAVQVGGLQDQARVGGRLEVREEGEGEEHLGEVVHLEVGVWGLFGEKRGEFWSCCWCSYLCRRLFRCTFRPLGRRCR